jgi:hypothetical protein
LFAHHFGKFYSGNTCTEDRKGQDEECCQTSAIESAGYQVRIVLEDAWAVVSEIELGDEPRNKLALDDASLGLVVRYVASKLDELSYIDTPKRETPNIGL